MYSNYCFGQFIEGFMCYKQSYLSILNAPELSEADSVLVVMILSSAVVSVHVNKVTLRWLLVSFKLIVTS